MVSEVYFGTSGDVEEVTVCVCLELGARLQSEVYIGESEYAWQFKLRLDEVTQGLKVDKEEQTLRAESGASNISRSGRFGSSKGSTGGYGWQNKGSPQDGWPR